jgi:hypothetical protein
MGHVRDQNLAATERAARYPTDGRHDAAPPQRLIMRIARVVAVEERCADYSDFKDLLRDRLRQLRIRYQPIEFDDAVSIVAANTRLWGAPAPRPLPPDRLQSEPPILSKAEASAVLARLRCRVRSIPRPRAGETDQATALRIVLDAIAEQTARVDRLERGES